MHILLAACISKRDLYNLLDRTRAGQPPLLDGQFESTKLKPAGDFVFFGQTQARECASNIEKS